MYPLVTLLKMSSYICEDFTLAYCNDKIFKIIKIYINMSLSKYCELPTAETSAIIERNEGDHYFHTWGYVWDAFLSGKENKVSNVLWAINPF